MKKYLFFSLCLLSTTTFAANSAVFVLPSVPAGLAIGSFSIQLSTVDGGYNTEGPVSNYGNYGLQGAIDTLNSYVNDTYNSEPVTHFPLSLRIKLTCANHASVKYAYHAEDLNMPGKVIVVKPPVNCAVIGMF